MSGKPEIILLHGWGGSKDSLKALASSLKESGFKTFALELPGHGSQLELTRALDMDDFSRWLKDEIKKLNIKDYVIIGHSFGGKLILNSVIEKVINPIKIFLINSSGIKPMTSIKVSVLKVLANVFRPISRFRLFSKIKILFYKIIVREYDYMKTSGALRTTFKTIIGKHYDDSLQKINIPTIIIWGDRDKVTPLWMGEKLKRGIKNSSLIVLNGGHNLPLVDVENVSKIIIKNI